MYHRSSLSLILCGIAMCLASTAWAQLPGEPGYAGDPEGSNPPVFQEIGMPDADLHSGGFEEADCRLCHTSGLPNRHHSLYGSAIPPNSLVPYPDADGDLADDTFYGCLNCHAPDEIYGDPSTGSTVNRDCIVCHTASAHHTMPDAVNLQCSECHGALVDDTYDGHYIPVYSPSLITPYRSTGDGSKDDIESDGTGQVLDTDCLTLDTGLTYNFGDTITRTDPNEIRIRPAGDNNDFMIDDPGRSGTYTYNVIFIEGDTLSPTEGLSADWDGASATLTVTLDSSQTAQEIVDAITAAVPSSGNRVRAGLLGDGTGYVGDYVLQSGDLDPSYSATAPNVLHFDLGVADKFEIAHSESTGGTYTVTFAEGTALAAAWDDETSTLAVTFVPLTDTVDDLVGAINAATGDSPLTAAGTALYEGSHYAAKGGEPANHRGIGAGSCNYCHDSDGALDLNGDPAPLIVNNHDTHHHIDLPSYVSDGAGGTTLYKCDLCHDYNNRKGSYHDASGDAFETHIRWCENCHGPESLHNIQGDSNGDDLIVVGGEEAGYGHVGRDNGRDDSDCWGCHGFEMVAGSVAPYTGPIIPTLYNLDVAEITTGTDATVVLNGVGFTNTANGQAYVSNVLLAADDGSSVTLTPDAITGTSMAVTIPGDTAPGNYKVSAVKDDQASNPMSLTVVPQVTIASATSDGAVTIAGSGFAGFAEGLGTSVTGTVKFGWGKWARTTSVPAEIISWSDDEIVVDFGPAAVKNVQVNSVFGAASAEVEDTPEPDAGGNNGSRGGFGNGFGNGFGKGKGKGKQAFGFGFRR